MTDERRRDEAAPLPHALPRESRVCAGVSHTGHSRQRGARRSAAAAIETVVELQMERHTLLTGLTRGSSTDITQRPLTRVRDAERKSKCTTRRAAAHAGVRRVSAIGYTRHANRTFPTLHGYTSFLPATVPKLDPTGRNLKSRARAWAGAMGVSRGRPFGGAADDAASGI